VKGKLDLGLDILDHQLADRDGRLCGKVDDIEFDGAPGKALVVSAILIGPGVVPRRLPRRLQRLADKFFGKEVIRVPASEVKEMDVVIKLKKAAGDYRLGKGDDVAARWLSRLPRS
jgi:hypothetical protein